MPNPATVLRDARSSYRSITEAFAKLASAGSQVRPEDPINHILADKGQDGAIVLTFKPIVCLVPERAKKTAAKLYVVVKGTLMLVESEEGELRTSSFATKVAYFEVRNGSMYHCFGGHYDFDPTLIAHPIAHLQICSQFEFQDQIREHFRVEDDLVQEDLPSWLHSRVRVPCAQMDVLSTLLQICADHLVNEKSSEEDKGIFNQLLGTCAPFKGYGGPTECSCHRAVHWYERKD